MNRLAEKVAIVTGGAQGIGRAIAEAYAGEGARVVVADTSAAEARGLCDELNAAHGRPEAPVALAVETDVSDRAQVEATVAAALGAFGRVDVLVNNAALWKSLERRPFWEVPQSEWDRVFAVNARGPFLCSAAVAPVMRRQRKGKIIVIGSATIWTAQSSLTAYVASKAAMIGFVRCAARDLGPDNICVNMIHPGITDSGGTPRAYLEERSKARFIPRVQEPADVTGACIFLASDESDFITGQQLNVDGGIVMS